MFNVWGIKLPGYFSFVAAVGLRGCRTISWPGWVTSSNLRLLACKTITILVTFRQASSFPLSSILMIRFTLNRQVACKDSLRGYFCINSCDEALAGTDSKTFFPSLLQSRGKPSVHQQPVQTWGGSDSAVLFTHGTVAGSFHLKESPLVILSLSVVCLLLI